MPDAGQCRLAGDKLMLGVGFWTGVATAHKTRADRKLGPARTIAIPAGEYKSPRSRHRRRLGNDGG